MTLEFVQPDTALLAAEKGEWELVDSENGTGREWVCDGHPCLLYTKLSLAEGALVRVPDPEYVSGKIRDNGR